MANLRTSRKSGFVLRGGVMRRETLWLGSIPSVNTIATASTALVLLSLNAAALALRPFTVIRVKGAARVASDQLGASENQAVGVGKTVVSDQAIAAGVGSVPTPVTDTDSDKWLEYLMMFSRLQFGTAVGFNSTGESFDIDSKAMRKVVDGEDLITVVETAATSSGVIFQYHDRTLVKLH